MSRTPKLRQPDRRLLCVLMVVIMGSFAWTYPLLPFSDGLTDQGKIVHYRLLPFLGFIGGILLYLGAYLAVLSVLATTSFRGSGRLVSITTTGLLASAVAMYPANAIDVFIYSVRSYLYTHYGQNPNSALPIDYWKLDPFVHFASRQWADNTSPYGPLWNQIAAPITWLSGDDMLVALIGFKLLNACAMLAIAALIHDIVRRREPDRALRASLFWLWNPLVLWEGVGNAHNDVVMMVPLMLALRAWTVRRNVWVIPLLTASFLIKYVALVLIPVALLALISENRNPIARARMFLIAVVANLVLGVASLAPFFDLPAVLDSARDQEGKFSASPGYLIVGGAKLLLPGHDIADTVRLAGYLGALIAIVFGAFACWRDPQRLPRASFEVMFVFLLVATMNLRPWYLIWLIPLAALTGGDWAKRRALVWSATGLLGYGHYIWIRRLWPWNPYSFEFAGVAFVLVPVLTLTSLELFAHWRARRAIARGPNAVSR